MKANHLKFHAAIAAAALLLTACSGGSIDPEVTQDGSNETTVMEEKGYELPSANYNGAEFNILLRSTSWIPEDIWSDGENGEVLNDAVYRRNRAIEEKYNIDLNATVAPEATGKDLNAYVSSFVLANDDDYDLVMIRVSDMATLARTGIFCDLLGEEELDFTQDFWPYEKLMETTVAGRLYYATGIITNAANALNICFFNKKLADDYKIGDVYSYVDDGSWTVDKLGELARLAAKDIDGNGKMTDADQFGITAQPNLAQMLFFASGEKMIDKDSNDIPKIAVGGERSYNVADKISTIMSDSEHMFFSTAEIMKPVWFEGRALFYFASLANAKVMRDSDFDFGLLPLPKYDESQEEYFCHMNAHNPCGTGIPVSVDSSRAATILQALVCMSDDEVIPAYYDTCLEGKYIRDEDSSRMLKIIFNSWRSDLADAYQWGQLSGNISAGINNGTGLASMLESLRPSIEEAISATVSELNSIK